MALVVGLHRLVYCCGLFRSRRNPPVFRGLTHRISVGFAARLHRRVRRTPRCLSLLPCLSPGCCGGTCLNYQLEMMGEFTLEIAVESTGAAIGAERGGADRIELCADLSAGGLSPSPEVMRETRNAVRVPIFAMIRPRDGNFVYTPEEFTQMRTSIGVARELKMDGVVLGILQGNKNIDVIRTKGLVDFASPMPVTFHRAFDECNDLTQGLEDVISTGATRILTSGGASDVLARIEVLQMLLQAARNRIVIMPGGGIQPANFLRIRQSLGAMEFHSGLGGVFSYGTEDFGGFEEAVRCLKYGKLRG
jgi:copper homeostasis protein